MAELTERVSSVERDIDAMKHDVIGLEHRLVQVVRNAFWALTQKEGWPVARRLEAGAALIRYFLVGRAALVLSVGLGGLLALHASFMLADQNRKLDLQNHLNIVASEVAEAQRNAQFVQLIPPLMEDVRREAEAASKTPATSFDTVGRPLRGVSVDTALRISVLSQSLQPYRWVEDTVAATEYLVPRGDGWLFRLTQSLRQVYTQSFGVSAFDPELQSSRSVKVPSLTDERYSPERGLLFLNLHASRVNLRGLTVRNVSFEKAYMPGARIEFIDLTAVTSVDASTPFNMNGVYLNDAVLSKAKVEGVSFKRAVCRRAKLSSLAARGSDWRDADFEAAFLDSADLTRAVLTGANMTGANLHLTSFHETDLTEVRGLTSDQLSRACINVKTTKLPSFFSIDSYVLPPDCCARTGESPIGARQVSGACSVS
jgi:uncharacterized protein YjbI with pentapeptide repeats